MGKIKQDVQDKYFRVYPEHKDIIHAFTHDFDINNAQLVRSSNTSIHCFLVKGSRYMSEIFGLSDEMLIVYSMYDRLEARTIQAIENVFSLQPFRSRANPLSFFLITNDVNGEEWVQRYLVDHPQFRTPIVINEKQCIKNRNEKSYIRNILYNQLFARDIFDYQLPLDRDLYFFGRSFVVDSIMDGIKKSQNKGLFGLRKTGKTSILFKVRRACQQSGVAYCLYIDCKIPMIREKNWNELIDYICSQILRIMERPNNKYSEFSSTERLDRIITDLDEGERVCLIFDEIEFISPVSKLNPHWKIDFTNFWQTIWSLQSQIRKLSVVIAGVNPYVTEVDLFNGVQNPMFGIVQGIMLTGLDKDSCATMIGRIGKQMGLHFEQAAVDYIHARYGGHPLLTRMACSYTNSSSMVEGRSRPIVVTERALKEDELNRDGELQFYCRHIVSELQDFYPDEYVLLELISRGSVVDFIELSAEPEWVRHLKGYGILNVGPNERPTFNIPVLQRYVANEAARAAGTAEPRETLPLEVREGWVHRRKNGIISEYKALLKLIVDRGGSSPYGTEYLPEADKLANIEVVSDWASFSSFINSINMCLVETIDNNRGARYFFNDLRSQMPSLFYSLNRIRVFRNNADHLRLNRNVEAAFRQYIDVDLQGRAMRNYKEPWYLLQQIVLDELLASIIIEINRVS